MTTPTVTTIAEAHVARALTKVHPSKREAPPVEAWTTYADLTPDQRARFGRYVQAKDEARSRMEANRAANARADAALKAAGGDPQKALALVLAGGV